MLNYLELLVNCALLELCLLVEYFEESVRKRNCNKPICNQDTLIYN
jgi:hypothetical protein